MTIVVAIEGLNRVGKDTQLNLLVEKYKDKGYSVLYMRGSGSRSGREASTFDDPESEYRQICNNCSN